METLVRLKDILKVCEALDKAVIQSIGPYGKLALLLDSTGHVMLTCSGIEIIERIGFCHPIAKLIVNAVISHHKVIGDNSKLFILILTEVIRKLVANVEKDSKHKESSSHHLAYSFSQLQTTILPEIIGMMTRKSQKIDMGEHDEFFQFLQRIITGYFGGKFVKSVCDCLSSLTLLLMKKLLVGTRNFSSALCLIDRYFDVICICAEGQPVTESFVVNGFVITRQYPESKIFTNKVNFILMKCKLDDLENLPVTFESVSKESSLKALHWTETSLAKVFDYYKQLGIGLILSEDGFSDVMLDMCHRRGIEVVQMVAKEEIDCLVHCCNILPVTNCFEILDSNNIKLAEFVKPISIGMSQYILLGIRPSTMISNFHTLVLNGPSFTFSKQYGKSISSCIKLLKTSLQNGYFRDNAAEKEIAECYAFPCGGIWEFLFSHLLVQYTSQSHLKPISCIFSDAILCVPRTLYDNSYHFKSKRYLFLQLVANNLMKDDNLIEKTNNNKILPFIDSHVLEVLISKYLLTNHLLLLIIQLLKLDSIISINNNKANV